MHPSLLVVEDDETIRETIRDALDREGFVVTACGFPLSIDPWRRGRQSRVICCLGLRRTRARQRAPHSAKPKGRTSRSSAPASRA